MPSWWVECVQPIPGAALPTPTAAALWLVSVSTFAFRRGPCPPSPLPRSSPYYGVTFIGCLGVMVFSLLFGLSSSIEMAVLVRLAMGLANPLAGLVKTLVSEICGPGA